MSQSFIQLDWSDYYNWTTHFPLVGRRWFSDWPGNLHLLARITYKAGSRQQIALYSYAEQQTEAVKRIYTPITFTSQRAHGEREGERDGKLPGQVDQQGAIDTRDLCWCQSESQTGSQLWFVPITLLTLFNLGFGQLRVSIHKENWEIHVCVRALWI